MLVSIKEKGFHMNKWYTVSLITCFLLQATSLQPTYNQQSNHRYIPEKTQQQLQLFCSSFTAYYAAQSIVDTAWWGNQEPDPLKFLANVVLFFYAHKAVNETHQNITKKPHCLLHILGWMAATGAPKPLALIASFQQKK